MKLDILRRLGRFEKRSWTNSELDGLMPDLRRNVIDIRAQISAQKFFSAQKYFVFLENFGLKIGSKIENFTKNLCNYTKIFEICVTKKARF